MAAIVQANHPGGATAASEKDFAELLARDTTIAVTRPEGFILMIVAGAEADIHSVEVARAARRRGIATAMMEEALAVAAARGVSEVFLEVDTGNEAALALYRRTGFVVVGRRRGYYRSADGGRRDAHIMAVSIPAKAKKDAPRVPVPPN